jgi:DNA mismatch endonuclease (patch repair protein)
MDILTRHERSRRMRAVRSKGNHSTEWKFRLALVRRGIRDWKMHPRCMPGVPDFFFAKPKVVIFIDGCFWHGCPRCRRPMPRRNGKYWANKLSGNVQRGRSINRKLRHIGFKVVRVWEHDLRNEHNLRRVIENLYLLIS